MGAQKLLPYQRAQCLKGLISDKVCGSACEDHVKHCFIECSSIKAICFHEACDKNKILFIGKIKYYSYWCKNQRNFSTV